MVFQSVGLSVEHNHKPAKMAGPIKVPHGMLTCGGPRIHVLDESPDPTRERGNYGEGMMLPLFPKFSFEG